MGCIPGPEEKRSTNQPTSAKIGKTIHNPIFFEKIKINTQIIIEKTDPKIINLILELFFILSILIKKITFAVKTSIFL